MFDMCLVANNTFDTLHQYLDLKVIAHPKQVGHALPWLSGAGAL
jgi:hypothetical protein